LLTGISDSINNMLKASKSSVNPLPERAQGTGTVAVTLRGFNGANLGM